MSMREDDDAASSSSNPLPHRRRGRRTLLAATVGTALALALLGSLAWQTCGFGNCPDIAQLEAMRPGGAPALVDRHGEVFADLAPSRQKLVRLSELPEYVADAFLAIEDKRFFEHHGVDLWRVGGAAAANLRRGGIAQGFSTITMQLARSAFPERLPVERRTMRRKLLEIRVAREIEQRYSKDEILELFLNHVYLGNAVRGIGTAARDYFGVDPEQLTLSQSAMLAALARSPGYYDPRRRPEAARRRRDLVLELMQKQGRITPEHLALATKAPLQVASRPRLRATESGLAPYAVEQIRRSLEGRLGDDLYAGQLRVFTTIDSRVQRAAEEVLVEQLRAIEAGRYGKYEGPAYRSGRRPVGDETPYLQGAIVVMDAADGGVLAWVGGRDFAQSHFDRAARGRRQAGSAFKPFVFAAALEEGFALSQRIDDAPLEIELARGRSWKPHNVGGRSEGLVTLRDALVHSNNLATIRLAQAVEIDRVAAMATRLGIEEAADGPSLALGSVTVSPLTLAAAFTALANAGVQVQPRFLSRVETAGGEELWSSRIEKKRVLDEEVAFLVTDVLRDALRRGTGRGAAPARTALPAAGKTGTTNDVSDAWFIGYTPELVVGIWIGFDRPRSIVDEATAGRLAAPAFARLVDRIYEDRETPAPWPRPAGVSEYLVDAASGLPLAEGCRSERATRELFLAGREPMAWCPQREALPEGAFYAALPGEGQRRDGFFARAADVWERLAGRGAPILTRAEDPRVEAPRVEDPEDAPPTPSKAAPSRREEALPTEIAKAQPKEEPLPARLPARVPASAGRAGAKEEMPVREHSVQYQREAAAPTDGGGGSPGGWWSLSTRIDSTSYPAFRGLRLGYRILLDEEGGRITGRGQKWSENGREISSIGRTPILVDGEMRGGEMLLRFREHGARRSTGGTLRLAWSPSERSWTGSFESSAADSRGSAVAVRMR